MLHIQNQALAYIDSGSGSFLIQMMLAGVLGGTFVVRNFWTSLVAKFSKKNAAADVD